jgi:hypothetical protein
MGQTMGKYGAWAPWQIKELPYGSYMLEYLTKGPILDSIHVSKWIIIFNYDGFQKHLAWMEVN